MRQVLIAMLVMLVGGGTALLSGCASAPKTLASKTSWYKKHKGSKSVPCPCGH